MINLRLFVTWLLLCLPLVSGLAQGEAPAGNSNWILAELGVGVQGAEIGRNFSKQFGGSAGWLRTRWSHWWKGEDPDTSTDTYRGMLRFSQGLIRIGVGTALRRTQGSAYCDTFLPRTGEKVSWQMTSIDMVGDIGVLYSSPLFLIGFTIVAAGRQVHQGSAKIQTALTLGEEDQGRIEKELRTDTSHGFSFLFGLNF